MYKVNNFSNDNKQVNYACGPQLSTKTVSSFISNHILSTMWLALTSGFSIY